MQHINPEKLRQLLDRLRLTEEPIGLFYTDTEPEKGFSPEPQERPTPEREARGEINWQAVFGSFSCVMGNIWRARKKQTAAWFSADRYGCPGGSFFLGFHKPQTETIIRYVSSGIPNFSAGEHYCESPDALRRIFEITDPRPAPATYCVCKPLSQFTGHEQPELVIFFARPESLCGLHQLATFATNDPEVVASPWSAACGGAVTWPLRYKERGLLRAVIGGWDPSARKYMKTDELFFSVPYPLFETMVNRSPESFLFTKTWDLVLKKIDRSATVWGEKKVTDASA